MRYPLPTLPAATQFCGGPELEIQFQGQDTRFPVETNGAKAHRASVWAICDGGQKAIEVRDIAVVNRDDEAARGKPVSIGGRPVPEPGHQDTLGLDATLRVDRGMGHLQDRARPEHHAIGPASGLIGMQLPQLLHVEIAQEAGIVFVVWTLVALAAFPAVRPYFKARTMRRSAAS